MITWDLRPVTWKWQKILHLAKLHQNLLTFCQEAIPRTNDGMFWLNDHSTHGPEYLYNPQTAHSLDSEDGFQNAYWKC